MGSAFWPESEVVLGSGLMPPQLPTATAQGLVVVHVYEVDRLKAGRRPLH